MADLNTARSALLRRDVALLVAAVVLIAIALGGFYFGGAQEARDQDLLELTRQAGADALEIAETGSAATRGVTPDFGLLSARVEDFDYTLETLRNGDDITGIEAAPAAVSEAVEGLATTWETLKGSINQIVGGESAYRTIQRQAAEIEQQLPAIASAAEALSEQLASGGAPVRQVQLATRQLARLERVAGALPAVLGEGRNAAENAETLRVESARFVSAHERLISGDDTLPALRDRDAITAAVALQEQYLPIANGIGTIVDSAATVDELQARSALLQGQAADLLAASKALEQALLDNIKPNRVLPVVSGLALLLAIAAIAGFFVIFVRTAQSGSAESEQRDARQQQAILGLLDEITNLADGDLTVDVTVTEDFTGAIADSINYTVQNMRALVGTITNTSERLADSAGETRQIAARMNQASEQQAKDVTAVTTQIAATSQSMQQVAGRAEQLAKQAQESVAVAHNGAQTVDRTIQGMNALREQIQDTAKRIKRLGESSQEIGNIIELINDIAEQTSTLALNASIQAAMAGEQGRGFAVVAEEVQRLAERASTATRQIEHLVKTIQADTNEAIISMERSTHNVVSGARSAEEAGGALTQVETSSQQIARLIQEISGAARNQSAAATTIAGQMQNIREIAVQTSGSAGQTAQAIGELSALSEQLRASVAGFKLPE
ncbi:methyl-accepting chemotaxis protein [Flagellatimonas centrodinii]|uniref:methyl-accepting chemotaxis protein n=1 Tax=Flagellatimonas centrodinii TaxID=2806210 RepID=UPI001FF05038|nr:methyl-accepting chemotaxis protein [Flagellatimonas centrodinii]ULQ46849.1 methyl-accepting chemotaxis protein [Flagellatimonas centrodinii]